MGLFLIQSIRHHGQHTDQEHFKLNFYNGENIHCSTSTGIQPPSWILSDGIRDLTVLLSFY